MSESNKNCSTPPEKSFEIRCPRLGHQINFTYCRSENNGLPCFKTLDCWHHYFDVHTFLKKRMTKDDFERTFLKTSQPKIFSLLDLIEQAKRYQQSKTNTPDVEKKPSMPGSLVSDSKGLPD